MHMERSDDGLRCSLKKYQRQTHSDVSQCFKIVLNYFNKRMTYYTYYSECFGIGLFGSVTFKLDDPNSSYAILL